MILTTIFIVSGVIMVALVIAKIIEDKKKRKPLLLRLVSQGDEHVKEWTHEMAHKYSLSKEKTRFFVEKQLPLHSKNLLNKVSTTIKERAEKHIGDIRGSKFLKRSDGLSEFFKNISEKESGGRIDDSLDSGVEDEVK